MFKWFKKQCQHEFTQWQVVKRLSNRAGVYVVIQERQCKACGLTSVNKQELY